MKITKFHKKRKPRQRSHVREVPDPDAFQWDQAASIEQKLREMSVGYVSAERGTRSQGALQVSRYRYSSVNSLAVHI